MEDQFREILNIQVKEYQHINSIKEKLIMICHNEKMRKKLEEAKLPISAYDAAVASAALAKAEKVVESEIDKTIQQIFDLFTVEEEINE